MSIAEKLTIIAENEQKVYDAGYLAGQSNSVPIDDSSINSESTWSSKNIVDKLCPSFTESGSAVVCEPVDGYPLKVISTLDANVDGYNAVNLHHGGKNLIPKAPSGVTETDNGTAFVGCEDGSIRISGKPSATATFYFTGALDAERLRGKQITINHNVGENVYLAVNLSYNDGTDTSYNWLRGNRAESLTKVVPNNAKAMAFFVAALTDFDGQPMTFYPQLEFGTMPTAYEQPKGFITRTANLDETVYGGRLDWNSGVLTATHGSDGAELAEPYTIQLTPQKILALSGVNTLCSDTGDTEVKGKADPVAVIEKLANAIIALGGNV